MTSLQATEPITTFLTARVPPPPRVILLYATPVPSRPRRTLTIHRILPAKPYTRPARIPEAAASGSTTATTSGRSTRATGAVPPPEPRPILIAWPKGQLDVKNVGWHSAAIKDYRATARQAVDKYLDHTTKFSELDASIVRRAQVYVEQAIPFLKACVDHWGALLLLQDQHKHKRDHHTKMARLAAKATAKATNIGDNDNDTGDDDAEVEEDDD